MVVITEAVAAGIVTALLKKRFQLGFEAMAEQPNKPVRAFIKSWPSPYSSTLVFGESLIQNRNVGVAVKDTLNHQVEGRKHILTSITGQDARPIIKAFRQSTQNLGKNTAAVRNEIQLSRNIGKRTRIIEGPPVGQRIGD